MRENGLLANLSNLFLKLDIQLPEETKKEVFQVYDEGFFVSHRDNGEWFSSTIHGGDWWQTNTPEHYGLLDKSNYHWTEVSEIAKETTRWLKEEFPAESYQRVRFMLLKPGGKIKAHHDAGNEERYEFAKNNLAYGAFNAAITQPKNCFLRDANTKEEVPFTERSVFVFNCWREHEAENNSDELRFHMIIHPSKWNEAKYNALINRSL